ncbi:MAG TPA: DNA double-strand break repair nuclease NurA [Candidatus Nanoarchaeia archaeon]|nr:DNA double-strand break repair nuclease NurA [Candidatus Nanoarchaeia archaeon]
MYEEIAAKVLESLKAKDSSKGAYPKFSSEDYIPFRIEAKNFHEIKNLDSKSIAFIDGGNAEIIGSANFSLSMIRASCVVLKKGAKTIRKKSESIVLVSAIEKNGEIHYKPVVFNRDFLDIEDVSFDSMDETLKNGVNRADVKSIPNAIRRFAELNMAKNAADNMLANIIVLDGNLQCTLTNEKKYLDALYESCEKNNIVLCALSKTSALFTDNGNLLSAALSDIAPMKKWDYHPIAEIKSNNHKAEMFFVKFHEKSNHIFRLEILKAQKENADEAISNVSSCCNDPVFIGYPFGLIEADRIARVSNNEKEFLKTMVLAKIGEKNVAKYLNSSNAHQILDKISF